MNDSDDVGGWTTLEMMRTKLAVRDVGRTANRGASREELLAKYPDLRDQDIELAKRIANDPDDESLGEAIDEIRFRRHPDHRPRFQVSEFDKYWGADGTRRCREQVDLRRRRMIG
jgi:uncharacterized protein (DUF433 family)